MTEQGATEHASLAAALVAFQADMPTVHKGQTATIPGKDGRSGYSYKYADLADVAAAAHPLLARHGLSFSAMPTHVEGVGFVLRGMLRHTSGEHDTGELPIVGRDSQAIGSSLTYNRRYLLGCMTGIVTDEDDDGSRAAAARTERPAAEPHETVPPREETLAKLDEACGALGKSRAEVTKRWRDKLGGFTVDRLDDRRAISDTSLFHFVQALYADPRVQSAFAEKSAEDVPEPTDEERAAAKDVSGAPVLCDATREHDGRTQKCTAVADHAPADAHVWW